METSLTDARDLAARLDCPVEAVELARDAEIIDLHLDTFILPRIWPGGYDILARHGLSSYLGHRFFGHCDLPRLLDGGVKGAMWSITTNPFNGRARRWEVFQRNLEAMRTLIASSGGRMEEVRTHRQYLDARGRGAHACLLSIQGLNALEGAPNGVFSLPDDGIVRTTVVHLLDSVYGATSSPASSVRVDKGLTRAGREVVAQLNARRIFVDLAHINERAFWDAVSIHDKSQPLIATHTGVVGVRPHWRNLTDAQIKVIADSGGVVGVIFNAPFLQRPGGPTDGAMVVEHIEHVINVAGEDAVAIGTDWDGAIVPPLDLAEGDSFPRLIHHMLRAGFSEDRIRKILGANFLRTFAMLRPG